MSAYIDAALSTSKKNPGISIVVIILRNVVLLFIIKRLGTLWLLHHPRGYVGQKLVTFMGQPRDNSIEAENYFITRNLTR